MAPATDFARGDRVLMLDAVGVLCPVPLGVVRAVNRRRGVAYVEWQGSTGPTLARCSLELLRPASAGESARALFMAHLCTACGAPEVLRIEPEGVALCSAHLSLRPASPESIGEARRARGACARCGVSAGSAHHPECAPTALAGLSATCPACEGRGQTEAGGGDARTCGRCGGSGRVAVRHIVAALVCERCEARTSTADPGERAAWIDEHAGCGP